MFTKGKFLQFPTAKQHKKCAEMLRSLYALPDQRLLSHYNEIQHWMQGEALRDPDAESIGDRYHAHLKEASISLREYDFLPKIRQGDKKTPAKEPWPIAIYLDNIRSAHNVGSILRTVEAFALGSVYFSPATPFISHRQVQKTSMGTFSSLHCSRLPSLDPLPKPLVVMETAVHATSLYDFLFPERFTLVVGNEEYGCSKEVQRRGEIFLEIPLRGRKNSLNVANAFAIAAAEMMRQKEHPQK